MFCFAFLFLSGAMWKNILSDMYAQQRLKSAWASMQSDQSLHCPHEETASLAIQDMPRKILIRLHEHAG